MNPVRTLIKNGQKFNVYSVTAGTFLKYLVPASVDFDGYFSFPPRAKELAGKYYGLDYGFVYHGGEQHLFVHP